MLSVRNATIIHRKDLRELIHSVSFTVSGQDRLAVIGEEGNGKSTLLRLIARPEQAMAYCSCSGAIDTGDEAIGYLPQELSPEEGLQPVYAFCADQPGFLELSPKELHALCARLRLDPALCYADCALSALSGGERIRLQLLTVLCAHPTLLLLDEPSNDLDIPSLQLLESFICTCGLPVVFISHDETLLTRTATRVLHLELAHHKKEPRWTLANMPYALYMQQRAQALEKQEAQANMDRREARLRQEKFQRIYQSVEHAQNTVSRQNPGYGAALKKKMKSLKAQEFRYERESEARTQRPNIEYALDASFEGDHSVPAGKRVLEERFPRVTAGERTLAVSVDLTMTGAEKVLIIGENGCGKTTLLRMIAQRLEARRDIRMSFMPQRYEEMLEEDKTPVEYLHTRGDKEQLTRLCTCLGALRFVREEMTRPIRDLSGGQKAKLLWLRILLSDANLLLLDEPTRNLSPLSAPVVRSLICGFQGAALAITHDRTLMRMWPGRVLRLTPAGLSPVTAAEIEKF